MARRFAIGGEGQIAVVCGQQHGLLLLDWPAAGAKPESCSGPAGGSVAETKEPGVERKAPPSRDAAWDQILRSMSAQ